MDVTEGQSAEPGKADSQVAERLCAKRRSRARVWAVGLILAAILTGVVAAVGERTAVGRAFGSSDHLQAEVVSVAKSVDQPRRRKHIINWTVQVAWTDGSGAHRATADLRSRSQPMEAGEQTDIFVAPGSDEISLGADNVAGSVVVVMFVALIGILSAGIVVWVRAGRWTRLGRALRTREPDRIRVRGVGERRARQVNFVEWTAAGAATGSGSFRVAENSAGELPDVDSELDVWAAGSDGSGPFLMRDRADGRCWTATGMGPP